VKQLAKHQLWVHRTLSGARADQRRTRCSREIAEGAAVKIHRTVEREMCPWAIYKNFGD
jgi:hypothetical protein